MHAPVLRGCDCDCGHVGAGDAIHSDPAAAPAAYLVRREGEELTVCTVCLREEDEILTILANPSMDPVVFATYDLLGFFRLTRNMAARGLVEDPGGLPPFVN